MNASWRRVGAGPHTGPTIRGYTPLHIAAWGTAKPQYDRDIVEAILNAAAKAGKDKEAACREATDKVDGETALDLVSVMMEVRPNWRQCSAPSILLLMCVSRPNSGLPRSTRTLQSRALTTRTFSTRSGQCVLQKAALRHSAAGSSPGVPGRHRACAASSGALPLLNQLN